MHAARVTSRSTLSRQQLPSAQLRHRDHGLRGRQPDARRHPRRAGARTEREAHDMRQRIALGEHVDALHQFGPPRGASTLTVIDTVLPFSTITGRSSFTRPSRSVASPTSSRISPATSAGVARAGVRDASGRISPAPATTRKRRRAIMANAASSGMPPRPRSVRPSVSACPAMRVPP